MATYRLTGKYETLLSSLSNDLSVEAKKRVSKKDVLERILDIVIEEERLLASNNEQPVSFFRRNIFQPPTKQPLNTKSSHEIINHIRSLVNKA